MQIPSGVYEHYKGKKYYVLCVCKHSETLEDLVVYMCLHDNEKSKLWVRPLEMFKENVEIDGERKPRFQYQEEM